MLQPYRITIALFLLGLAAAPHAEGIDWPQLTLGPPISGFSQPTHIANAADGSGRLFVVEQGGYVRIVKNGVVQGTAFLDIHTRVSCCGERGLLSIAFPPGFSNKGYFYVFNTNTAGDLVIARYFVTPDPDVADPDSEVIVLTIPHPTNSNHNGGQLAFGPDGYLYIGPGDGGAGGDPPNNAQNPAVLLGKILRIDVESGGAQYAIPSSNPFTQTAGYRPEIWALGTRNPWRFSFDRQTGDLYIGDVGQGSYEEVDYQPAGSPGGQNYGWRVMEGLHCYNATTCDMSGLTLPVTEYNHATGDCSITGGHVYRGSQFARMQGLYFYGDFCTGRIWGLRRDAAAWQSMLLYDAPFQITSFGEDEAGNVYVTDRSSGAVRMLTDLPPQSPTSSLTVTPTPTASRTPTVTPTRTATPSPTRTHTPGPTSTRTPTRTITPTSTRTPSATVTPTPTRSATPAPTATNTVPPICLRLLPNGQGTFFGQNLPAGCAHNWECTTTNDGDTAHVYSPSTQATGPRSDVYALDDVAPRPEPIVSVAVHMVSRALLGAGSTATTQLKPAGAQTYAGTTLAALTTYTEAVAMYATNPATGLAWSWTDIAGLQAGVLHQVAAGDELRTTYVGVDVCWVPSPGSGQYAISGAIRYTGSGLPVSGVTVGLSGPATETMQTNATGAFAFVGLPADTWTIEPRRTQSSSSAINAADALAALRAAVGDRPLDAVSRLACDVNGDGRISSTDALLILYYNVGIIPRLPAAERCGSDWVFVPEPEPAANQHTTSPSFAGGACQLGGITLAPLAGEVTAQDFTAALIGDCSLNWTPTSP